MSRIKAVVFDVGETLVDETRLWHMWADWLRVPRETFMTTMHDVIARREHHRTAFEILKPGFDLPHERAAREAAGWPPDVAAASELYPDALPCLRELQEHGFRIGIAGNQPEAIEAVFQSLDIACDLIASSARWGVVKPEREFFQRIIRELALSPEEIAYVGDRVDNDIIPAAEAGMASVFLRRGPWGVVHAEWPEAQRATLRVDTLNGLAARVALL